MSAPLQELLKIMRRLRAADGCAWDRQQDFASIAPHTIEEAYEVADAIERRDMADLKDELGDLLFQVVFHAQLASEAGEFDFDAVAQSICRKLLRRHPHVFGGSAPLSAAEQSAVWEDIKAAERALRAAPSSDGADAVPGPPLSLIHGVPMTLPALLRAHKLSQRAARVGFDFEHAAETADKVAEELAEVREAVAGAAAETRGGAAPLPGTPAGPPGAAARVPDQPSPQVVEEVGDLLFAAANLARKLGVDPEAALRAANSKFERRFRGMERLAVSRGVNFAELDLAAQERLWQEVKRGE
jgi:ATP diphosphatase